MLNIDLSLIIMLYIATQSQDQTSEPHSTTITVKDATPGTLPMVELKSKMQCHIIEHILCVFCL